MTASDRKRLSLLAIAITVLAIGILTWTYFSQWETSHQTQTSGMVPNKNGGTITILPSGQIPPNMPQNIVLASDAKIVNSYVGVTAQGKQQATLMYETQKPTSDMYGAYIGFFNKNGWQFSLPKLGAMVGANSKIISAVSSNDLIATKQENQLTVAFFSENASTTMVSLTVLSGTN